MYSSLFDLEVFIFNTSVCNMQESAYTFNQHVMKTCHLKRIKKSEHSHVIIILVTCIVLLRATDTKRYLNGSVYVIMWVVSE